jgi:tRNA(adenine34) deaminase
MFGKGNLDHHYFLEQALQEALIAKEEKQNPIGCVIVSEDGEIIARGHNQVTKLSDPTAHAEMMAIRSIIRANNEISPRIWSLYTSIEPCPMCLGTIIMCHIGTIVWAAPDRRMQSHTLLLANPYMKSRKLVTIDCPYPDLERKCSEIHDAYWIAQGRRDAIEPMGK